MAGEDRRADPRLSGRLPRRPCGAERRGLVLTVELDSYAFHNSRHAFENDHRRQRDAYARGDQWLSYTYGDVLERPETVLAELVPLLSPAGSRAA